MYSQNTRGTTNLNDNIIGMTAINLREKLNPDLA